LAQGKTVLVTAHTTKALRVLRNKVDETLQPLCLSVLEGDAESQAQLSRAAQAIADRLSRSDAASLRREAAILRDKRQKLLATAEALRRQMRDARCAIQRAWTNITATTLQRYLFAIQVQSAKQQ
jgi:hypothetical protein